MIEVVVSEFKERDAFSHEAGEWMDSMMEKYPGQYLPIVMLTVYFLVSHYEKVMLETEGLDAEAGHIILAGVLGDALFIGEHLKGSTQHEAQLAHILGQLKVGMPSGTDGPRAGGGGGGGPRGTDGAVDRGGDEAGQTLGSRLLRLFRPRTGR